MRVIFLNRESIFSCFVGLFCALGVASAGEVGFLLRAETRVAGSVDASALMGSGVGRIGAGGGSVEFLLVLLV